MLQLKVLNYSYNFTVVCSQPSIEVIVCKLYSCLIIHAEELLCQDLILLKNHCNVVQTLLIYVKL